ncbi:MAG TPA: ABC transporter substrate-binding protein [Polyangiaceae bacterium]|nr:ABC transporter substrate-binding protein [Polyangiaceae bacterium]
MRHSTTVSESMFLRLVLAVFGLCAAIACNSPKKTEAAPAPSAAPASPTGPVKIGVLASFSGPFADYGKNIEAGMRTYLKLHGDTYGGRKVELVVRDTTGPAPDVAKRLAQELLTRDKVDFLAGFGFTPNAMAVAPLATEAKKPMIVMNAASSVVTTKSPYIARFSFTLPQVTAPLAGWAAKNGIKKVYSLVADYAPGIDAETTFKKAFTAAGGQVIDAVRVPLKNPDYAPFLQRVKDSKPEAVFIFLPAGEPGIAFMKAFNERGLAKAGIKLIGTGDLTDDSVLMAMGDSTLGVITTHHYSAAHDSPENKEFVKAFGEVSGGRRPNFMAVGGYDGMAAIAETLNTLHGAVDGDAAMRVLENLKLTSPRGPISIDPATRDIVQTVYLRHVEKVGNELFNVESERFENVKDPGK